MIMSSLLRHFFVGLCASIWTVQAFAVGNCPRGQILYNTPVRGVTCSNATCHGTDLSKNLNWILWGNEASHIAQAIRNGGGGMSVLQGQFTDQDLEDLAAWIASWPTCPVAGAPEVSVSPGANDFSAQDVGTTSAAITIAVSNTGTFPATDVTVANSNALEFPASTTCAATLPSGASCTITASFRPSVAGLRSATLTVDSNAGSRMIGLYGTGTAAVGNMLDAIEYYYTEFNSYFITALADEIRKLDSGQFIGWSRTGLQFKVHALGTPGSLAVCRFYSVAFGPKSAHFYTSAPDECSRLKNNPDWIFEDEVFAIPSARADGSCAAGTVPIYRLYNNGEGGAPNHRYTTVPLVRDAMLMGGWVLEGNGPGFAFMCAPQ